MSLPVLLSTSSGSEVSSGAHMEDLRVGGSVSGRVCRALPVSRLLLAASQHCLSSQLAMALPSARGSDATWKLPLSTVMRFAWPTFSESPSSRSTWKSDASKALIVFCGT